MSLYRLVVPRQVSKALNPVNVPSVRSILTPRPPKVVKRRKRR